MNFYEHQDKARAMTGRLVVAFSLAILTVIVTVYAFFVVIWALSEKATLTGFSWWQPQVAIFVIPGVLLAITIGTVVRLRELSGGGAAVAERLGGREVPPSATDPDERRLRNVVEEMSIASGVPVPRVFVLPESSINAFAAGLSINDAAVAVTQGCIKHLTRDELQAVVAHEFSHIANGDMRLNVRLIAFIGGLMAIGTTGVWILRMAVRGGRGASRRRDGRAVLAMLAIGLGLTIIGYTAMFAGRLIQAAISRQREFLADAAGAQFTRNPGALASALARIAGATDEEREIVTRDAGDMAHMFFSNISGSLLRLTATHPPVEERIRRLGGAVAQPTQQERVGLRDQGLLTPEAVARFATVTGRPVPATAQPVPEHPLDTLDADYRSGVHDPMLAPAVMQGLLLPLPPHRDAQLAQLAANTTPGHAERVAWYADARARLRPGDRLLLARLAAPQLRTLPSRYRQQFLADLRTIASSDGLSVFEALMIENLRAWTEAEGQRTVQSPNPGSFKVDGALALVTVLHAAEIDPDAARAAVAAAAKQLRPGMAQSVLSMQPSGATGLGVLFARLRRFPHHYRIQLANALVAGLAADGGHGSADLETIGAFASLLEVPAPIV